MLLALSGSYSGETKGQGECYVCLSRKEALAAADSALYGQSMSRSVAIYKAAYAVRKMEADTLRRAFSAMDSAFVAARDAGEERRQAVDILQTALEEEKKRSRWLRKTPWIAAIIGVAVGYMAGKE